MKYTLALAVALIAGSATSQTAPAWRLSVVTTAAIGTGLVVTRTFYAYANGGECGAQLAAMKLDAGANTTISAVCEKVQQ